MLIKEYVSTSDPRPEGIDLVNELSTVPRATIHGEDDVDDQVSVKYKPKEFVKELVDEEWDNNLYRTPVETTVMVVDEDEVIDRESVIEAKS